MESSKCKGSEPQINRNLKGSVDVNQPRKGSFPDSTSRRPLVSGHGSQSSNMMLLGTAKLKARGQANAAGRVYVPKPVNLPSLRKEHGIYPTAQLVPFSGGKSRWSKIHHDPGDTKDLANLATENSAEPSNPDTIMWSTKGSCEMHMHNNPHSCFKSCVEENSSLNAHEYPRLGTPASAESAILHNQQSLRLLSTELRRSPDASRFESKRWQEDEREYFPLSGNRLSWFDDDTSTRQKMPTHNSRVSLAQDLSDLPGMPGKYSMNHILSSQEDVHIPKSVLDVVDEDYGFPKLQRVNDQSTSAKMLRSQTCIEHDPEREAFHAELERVAATIEQENEVNMEDYAEADRNGPVAFCCSRPGKGNLSLSVEKVLESACTRTVFENNAISQWQMVDNNNCYQNQVAERASALQIIATHSEGYTAEDGVKDASNGDHGGGGIKFESLSNTFELEQYSNDPKGSHVYRNKPAEESVIKSQGTDITSSTSKLKLANDGSENLIPPGHMGISWGSQGVFGPGLLAAASSETLRALGTDFHMARYDNSGDSCLSQQDVRTEILPFFDDQCVSTAPSVCYEPKSSSSAKIFRCKENCDNFGDICSMVSPVRQWLSNDASVQSEDLPEVPSSKHDEVSPYCCTPDVHNEKCVVAPLRNICRIPEKSSASDDICLGEFSNMKIVLDGFHALNMAKTSTKDTGQMCVSGSSEDGNCVLAKSADLEGTVLNEHSQHFMYSCAEPPLKQNGVYRTNDDIISVQNPQQHSVIQPELPGVLYGGDSIHQPYSIGNWHVPPPPPPQIERGRSDPNNILQRQKECPLTGNPLTQDSEVQLDVAAVAPGINSYYPDMSRHIALSSVHAPKSNVGNISGPLIHPTSGMTYRSMMEALGVGYGSFGPHAAKNPSKSNSVTSSASSSFVMSGKRPDWSAPSRRAENSLPFMQSEDGNEKSLIIGAPFDPNHETVLLQNIQSTGLVENSSKPGQHIKRTPGRLALNMRKQTNDQGDNIRQMDSSPFCIAGLADVFDDQADAESNAHSL